MPAHTKVKHQGRTVDRATRAAMRQVEMVLGYDEDSLDLIQGGYNGGRVTASGRTHDGAGALDLTAANHRAKVDAGRFVGIAIWFRPKLVKNGKKVWDDHVHGIVWCTKIFDRIPAAAQRQIRDARQDLDGLASHGRDTTGAPILRDRFYYGLPVSLDLMRTLSRTTKPAPPGSVRHIQVARVRKALKREGIRLTSPNRTWPANEWLRFERDVLKRATPNRIPDARALIQLGRRHSTFMAQH